MGRWVHGEGRRSGGHLGVPWSQGGGAGIFVLAVSHGDREGWEQGVLS